MAKKFKKTVENFICQVCGTKVKGTGFTDHCPKCLFSKHVDINPGDRESPCLGLMEPQNASLNHGVWKISYICRKCGYRHTNKANLADSIDTIIELSTHPV